MKEKRTKAAKKATGGMRQLDMFSELFGRDDRSESNENGEQTENRNIADGAACGAEDGGREKTTKGMKENTEVSVTADRSSESGIVYADGSEFITLKAMFLYNGMPVILPDDPYLGIKNGTEQHAVGEVDLPGLLGSLGINPTSLVRCVLTLEDSDGVSHNPKFIVKSYPKTGFSRTVSPVHGNYEIPLGEIYAATGNAGFLLSPVSGSTDTDKFAATRSVMIEYEKARAVRLIVSEPPARTAYGDGERFDGKGMVINVEYSDGTVRETEDYSVDKEVLSLGDTRVTVSYEGVTTTQEITVYEGMSSYDETGRYGAFENFRTSAGDAALNLHDGHFILKKRLFSLPGARLPLSLTLVYNDRRRGETDSLSGLRGWKLDAERYVYGLGNAYIYVDENFARHTFAPSGTFGGRKVYCDRSGTGLLMYEEADRLRITDDKGTSLVFSLYGGYHRLTEITDEKGDVAVTAKFGYEGDRLVSVTDGEGRTAKIKRTASSISVLRPDGKTIEIGLSGADVTEIKDADGGISPYTYSDGMLVSAGRLYEPSLSFGYSEGRATSAFLSVYGRRTHTVRDISGISAEYAGRYTRVARYGYGRTTPYKTEIYAFADDGKFIANYEDSDDAPGVRFVSADRYNAYLTVLGEGGKKVTVDGSERRTVDLSSPSVTIFESDEFSADVSPGERLVVTAEVRITDVTRREEGAIASFGVTGDAESPALYADLGFDGRQILSASIDAPLTGKYRLLFFLSGWTGRAEFRDIRISACPAKGVTDAVAAKTGGRAVTEYLPNGTRTWYALTDCREDGRRLTVTGADLRRTQEHGASGSGERVFWTDDLTCAHVVPASARIGWDVSDETYDPAELLCASVTYRGSEKTFVYASGGDASGRTFTVNRQSGETSAPCRYVVDDKGKILSRTFASGAEETVTYDAYGNETGRMLAAEGESVFTGTERSSDGGRYVVAHTEHADGKRIVYKEAWDASSGTLEYIEGPSGERTEYEYDDFGRPVEVRSSSLPDKNTLTYSLRLPASAGHNGGTYAFEYDDYCDVTALRSGNIVLTERARSRSPLQNTEEKTAYGGTVRKTTDAYGREIKREYREAGGEYTALAEYTYGQGGAGRLLYVTDRTYASPVTFTYSYDDDGRLASLSGNGTRVGYDRDGAGRVFVEKYTTPCHDYEVEYGYDVADAFTGDRIKTALVTGAAFDHTEDAYDALGRRSGRRSVYASFDDRYACTESMTYAAGVGANSATFRPSSLTVRVESPTEHHEETETYSYDGCGRISEAVRGGKHTRYAYDVLGRLVREDNEALGRTRTFAYDAGGNITSVRETAYTTGDVPSDAATTTYEYEQGTDVLTRYGGRDIVYSGGLPVTYNGASLKWTRCGLLASYGSTHFEYGADGLRTRKRKGAAATEYTYVGGEILCEKRTASGKTARMTFLRNHTGTIGFVLTDGENVNGVYRYIRNMRGDVVAIYGSDGSVRARYEYDAWGNHTVTEDIGGIGTLNPLRYRGYYYDTETGLYYLKARYYDPRTGRFISADDPAYMEPGVVNGLNLYAYCLNDPISYTDPEGNLLWFIAVAAAGFALSFGTSAATQYLANDGEIDWTTALIDGAFGAVSSLLDTISFKSYIDVLIDTGLTFVNSVITAGINNGGRFTVNDLAEIGINVILSFVSSTILGEGFLDIDPYKTVASKALQKTLRTETFDSIGDAIKRTGSDMISMYTTKESMISLSSAVIRSLIGNVLSSLLF